MWGLSILLLMKLIYMLIYYEVLYTKRCRVSTTNVFFSLSFLMIQCFELLEGLALDIESLMHVYTSKYRVYVLQLKVIIVSIIERTVAAANTYSNR